MLIRTTKLQNKGKTFRSRASSNNLHGSMNMGGNSIFPLLPAELHNERVFNMYVQSTGQYKATHESEDIVSVVVIIL